jgi:hypothetical protein
MAERLMAERREKNIFFIFAISYKDKICVLLSKKVMEDYLPRPPPLREAPEGEPKLPPLEVEPLPVREDVIERLVLRLEERFTVLFSECLERSDVLRFTVRSDVLRFMVRSEALLEERSVALFAGRFEVRSVTRL